jgi:hypothetical protein
MPKTIIQAAILPAPPDQLFDMYLDPAAHAAFTGRPSRSAASRVRRSGLLTT